MISLPFAAPSLTANDSWAGGETSGADIFAAAGAEQNLVSNSVAAHDALQDAYDDRLAAIKARLGVTRPNPMVDAPSLNPFANPRDPVALYRDRTAEQRDFENWLYQLQAEHPEAADVIRAGTPVKADAEKAAAQSEQQLGQAMAAHPGWDKYVWNFLGAGAASLRDPLVLGSFFFGGGPGGAKTVAGRILQQATRDAALNAAATAAAQPMVQAWRQQVGLESGFGPALENIATAAAFGGVLGGGMRGLGEAGALLARHGSPDLAAAAGGDVDAAGRVLDPIRSTLSPEARGALDANADLATLMTPVERDAAAARRAQLLADRAQAEAQRREPSPLVLEDDEGQIARVADQLAPAPDTLPNYVPPAIDPTRYDQLIADMRRGAPDEPAIRRPVAAFLKRLGGVDPASLLADELRHAGITSRTIPGLYSREGNRVGTPQGVHVTPPRRALDNIPLDELPEDIRQKVGDDGNGYAREQDLVDALVAEHAKASVNPIAGSDRDRQFFERQGVDFNAPDDVIKARLAQIDEARARFEAKGSEIDLAEPPGAGAVPASVMLRQMAEDAVRVVQRQIGGTPADEVVHMAADLVLNEHEPVADAVEFAMGHAAGAPRRGLTERPAGRFDELGAAPPPLAEATAPDAAAAVVEGPDPLAAELDALPRGEAIPTDDGLLTPEEIKAGIDGAVWLERVVDACKS